MPYRTIILVLASLTLFLLVVGIAGLSPDSQGDFRIYYWAARAHALGRDPYDRTVLHELGGVSEASTGFVYPPCTLYFFRTFLVLDYPQARLAYLGLKCVLLLGLVWLWRSEFLREDFNVWFLLFVLLAFNSATCHDLISGNIQLLELTLLWVAFAFYVRGQDLAFGLLLLLAASFNVLPIAFLGLFLMEPGRRRWLYPLVLGLCFLAGFLLARRFAPELFPVFLRSAIDDRVVQGVREEGWNNPALWPLLQAIRGYLSQVLDWNIPFLAAVLVYLLLAGLVWVHSWRLGRRLTDPCTRSRRTLQVYLACFAYALAAPHMRPHSYMLLLVPAFHLVRHAPPLHSAAILAILVLLPANSAAGLPLLAPVGVIVIQYYLWLSAAVLWGLSGSLCRTPIKSAGLELEAAVGSPP